MGVIMSTIFGSAPTGAMLPITKFGFVEYESHALFLVRALSKVALPSFKSNSVGCPSGVLLSFQEFSEAALPFFNFRCMECMTETLFSLLALSLVALSSFNLGSVKYVLEVLFSPPTLQGEALPCKFGPAECTSEVLFSLPEEFATVLPFAKINNAECTSSISFWLTDNADASFPDTDDMLRFGSAAFGGAVTSSPLPVVDSSNSGDLSCVPVDSGSEASAFLKLSASKTSVVFSAVLDTSASPRLMTDISDARSFFGDSLFSSLPVRLETLFAIATENGASAVSRIGLSGCTVILVSFETRESKIAPTA
mmetsp:Transcript_36110/g.84352  ORF Transcript_36110/g.84352 Transcript_36110/m.84352 type:complete len:310 (+) Transcript_36110:883-1812(+)